MATVELQTSGALRRVAARELDRLARAEERVAARRETLRQELAGVDAELRALRERAKMLDRLVQGEGGDRQDDDRTADVLEGEILRGAEIRRTAVRLLLDQEGPGASIHYRDWLGLLVARGFAVLGKNPHATFLSNITRSPVVARAPEPGTYMVDAGSVPRLRAELAEAQAELRDLTASIAQEGVPSTRLSDHRAELTAATRRLEAQVLEAEEALAPSVAPAQRRAA